jgi:hypothetical protein
MHHVIEEQSVDYEIFLSPLDERGLHGLPSIPRFAGAAVVQSTLSSKLVHDSLESKCISVWNDLRLRPLVQR